MSEALKLVFQLTEDNGHLEVRVSGRGEQAGETALPSKAILDEIAKQDVTAIPRRVLEEAGQELYKALVNEGVDELVADTLNDGIRANTPVQFELRFDADQVGLTRFPWEMIQNKQGQFLIRDGLVDLTRYITYPQPPPVFDSVIKNLPLFHVVADPDRLPPITPGELTIRPLERLNNASFDQFLRTMLLDRLPLWGIHFDGHGALVAICSNCDTANGENQTTCRHCELTLKDAKRVGALAFDKEETPQWIQTSEFGSVLYNANIRLAMILACDSAKVGDDLVFSGLAPGLLLAGVPAVIGMQYPIRDTFAEKFSNQFYEVFQRDGDLLTALRIARRLNMQDSWYSPVLYLRRRPAEKIKPQTVIYMQRHIDTAAPSQVKIGERFLARVWLRRPETKALTETQLRDELDIPEDVPVKQSTGKADVKFEPVEGRKLRRGEVEVKLRSPGAEVFPESVKLFIDEHLDAPPAIFTVKATESGRIPLIFTVWQDDGQIHAVIHHLTAIDTTEDTVIAAGGAVLLPAAVTIHSQPVEVGEGSEIDLGIPKMDDGDSDESTYDPDITRPSGLKPAPKKEERKEEKPGAVLPPPSPPKTELPPPEPKPAPSPSGGIDDVVRRRADSEPEPSFGGGNDDFFEEEEVEEEPADDYYGTGHSDETLVGAPVVNPPTPRKISPLITQIASAAAVFMCIGAFLLMAGPQAGSTFDPIIAMLDSADDPGEAESLPTPQPIIPNTLAPSSDDSTSQPTIPSASEDTPEPPTEEPTTESTPEASEEPVDPTPEETDPNNPFTDPNRIPAPTPQDPNFSSEIPPGTEKNYNWDESGGGSGCVSNEDQSTGWVGNFEDGEQITIPTQPQWYIHGLTDNIFGVVIFPDGLIAPMNLEQNELNCSFFAIPVAPGTILGEYQVEVWDEQAGIKFDFSFTLTDTDIPAISRIYDYDQELYHIWLLGFQPGEHIRVILYTDKGFWGQTYLQTDKNGMMLFTEDSDIFVYGIIAIGQHSGQAYTGFFSEDNPPEEQPFLPDIVERACRNAPPSRLWIGAQGLSTFTDGQSLRVRSEPDTKAETIIQMIEGTGFTVIGGYVCNDGWIWWQLRWEDGTVGWSAEGDIEQGYFIEPIP